MSQAGVEGRTAAWTKARPLEKCLRRALNGSGTRHPHAYYPERSLYPSNIEEFSLVVQNTKNQITRNSIYKVSLKQIFFY